MNTRGYLHSHSAFKSPLSNNQEVSVFGSDQATDAGDLWKLECDTPFWEREKPIRLKHLQTSQVKKKMFLVCFT